MNSYSKRCSSSEDSFELQGSTRSEAKSFVKSKNKDEGYRPHRSKHCQKGGEKSHGLEHSSLYPAEVGNASQKLQRQKKTHKKSSSSASDLSLLSQGSSSSLSVVEEKIEAKLKFSQFINEVTFRVLDPMSLRAYRAAKLKNTFPTSARSLDDLHIKRKSSESWKDNISDGKTHEEVDLESLRNDDVVAGPRTRKLEKSLSLDTSHSLRQAKQCRIALSSSKIETLIHSSDKSKLPEEGLCGRDGENKPCTLNCSMLLGRMIQKAVMLIWKESSPVTCCNKCCVIISFSSSPANTVPDRAIQRYFWFLNPYQQCNPDKSEPQQFHFISDHSQAFRKRKIFMDYPFPYCMNATKCNEHEKQASK
ncbi:hypothetical protein Q9233_000876 [Columba guinea]|nr:hypothetical protein Q9233_000876 [Columba guinea]